MVSKRRNRNHDRIGVIESRLECIERQLDRQFEPSSPKTRD
jgi:hypothetical protein